MVSRIIKSVAKQTEICKCCGEKSVLYDVVDLNKHFNDELKPDHIKISGIPVYYYKCNNCNFIFSTILDKFKNDDFKKYIYNDDYKYFDPDYETKRPLNTFNTFTKQLLIKDKNISILDYGCGSRALETILKENGYLNTQSYDPYCVDACKFPTQKFDCILATEVVEHSINPTETFKDMSSLLNSVGAIIFTTLISDDYIKDKKCNWWYILPRNGHISIYTKKSLQIISKDLGLNFISINPNLHLLFKNLPPSFLHNVIKFTI